MSTYESGNISSRETAEGLEGELSASERIADFQDLYLVFYVGGDAFSLVVAELEAIIELHQLTPVPLAARFVDGITNLRGKVLTVVDFALFLGMTESKDTDALGAPVIVLADSNIGLRVERVSGYVSIHAGAIEEVPAGIEGKVRRYLRGVSRHEDRIVHVADREKLLEHVLASHSRYTRRRG